VVEVSEADVGGGKLAISALATEIGAHNATIDCLAFGKEVSVKFNHTLVLEALAAITTEDVAIEFSGSSRPAIFKPVGDNDSALHLIYPMTVR